MHRVGELKPGEPIVLVAVWSAHRRDAFEASRYLMEELKSRAPLWKKERLEEATGLSILADGFPTELVDDEPALGGHGHSVGRDRRVDQTGPPPRGEPTVSDHPPGRRLRCTYRTGLTGFDIRAVGRVRDPSCSDSLNGAPTRIADEQFALAA